VYSGSDGGSKTGGDVGNSSGGGGSGNSVGSSGCDTSVAVDSSRSGSVGVGASGGAKKGSRLSGIKNAAASIRSVSTNGTTTATATTTTTTTTTSDTTTTNTTSTNTTEGTGDAILVFLSGIQSIEKVNKALRQRGVLQGLKAQVCNGCTTYCIVCTFGGVLSQVDERDMIYSLFAEHYVSELIDHALFSYTLTFIDYSLSHYTIPRRCTFCTAANPRSSRSECLGKHCRESGRSSSPPTLVYLHAVL